ncbi:DEAD/DEAH box helicase family protein [Sunxiuqinia rutila]|uniref:DEAD/DEAH box helicase family protein n=1 Tax=Sunxiuqinia rutila TaxID=1397841 RepID=UPI003D35FC98
MHSNFSFLQGEWDFLFRLALEAEKNAKTAPVTSVFYARLTLEKIVNWLYENEGYLNQPYQTNLAARMAEPTFVEIIPPTIYGNIDYIRKMGNIAAHQGKASPKISVACIRFLYRFLSWTAKMYSEAPPEVTEFDEEALPKVGAKEKTKHQLEQLEEKNKEQIELANRERKKRIEAEEELAKMKEHYALINERKKNNTPVQLPAEQFSEAKTRELYIDAMLREAGWNPQAQNAMEYPVVGMPKSVNPTGNGYVDYVLWGDNGLPLAVVEAKKASRSIHEGKHQAELYANCLEKMTGQRPVIYYSNGFETEIWDDTFYAPRTVHGFNTKEELQTIVNRRSDRIDPRIQPINNEITNRVYQKLAIKSVLDKFIKDAPSGIRGGSRKALIVMATGTGKTRTAISFVDVLFKAGWIKKVLFLADRNALVTQAKRNFNKLLPHLSSIDLTKEKEDTNTRLVFSTYPTIMNSIDGVHNGEERFYSVGHFDLIIVDEAHRSVYQKYGAIFQYFDALMLGLTATPKDSADYDTYRLFDEEQGIPTFDYELEEAVDEEYLVPFKAKQYDLGFVSRGIQYDELTPEEQARYEETFRDEQGNVPDAINASAINSWLFNEDTVDKVLDILMSNGIKVEGGDKVGKTIIFAKNHPHALFIEERFNKLYPQYGNKFLRVIDNYEKYAQDLIDDFELIEKMPQIAVSVDMLDTGIDVPPIVNLVIFKPVYSKSKFWQMIGRGTRLCPNLIAPGVDKTQFNVFDFCRNFSFFNENETGIEPSNYDSVSARIFKNILSIAEAFRSEPYLDNYHQKIRTELLDWLHGRTVALNKNTFTVKMVLRTVEKFCERKAWNTLTNDDIHNIFHDLAGLIFIPEDDEKAKRFDGLMTSYQLAIAENAASQTRHRNRIIQIANQLSRLLNINEVAKVKNLIIAVTKEEFWEQVNYQKLELVRTSFRSLIQYIPENETVVYRTDFEDEILGVEEVDVVAGGYTKSDNYRLKVEKYIRENKNHLVIQKLRNNVKLTSAELQVLEKLVFEDSQIGSKDDYIKNYGEQPLGKFIRSLLGLEEEAVQQAFSEFIDTGNLRAEQIQFIRTIVTHFKINGILELHQLAQPPFTEINDNGIFGLFDDEDQDRIIRIVEDVNDNAVG